ncbi:hypothetical protein [Streptomyces goshikiensis]|uniref:hypothetical protein n=1 Tax=Streptomyces goshikiensis TaxID=1942 RepID=UPI0036697FF7
MIYTGYGFTPGPAPAHPDRAPAADITGPDARKGAADLLAQIAAHFHSTLAPATKW